MRYVWKVTEFVHQEFVIMLVGFDSYMKDEVPFS